MKHFYLKPQQPERMGIRENNQVKEKTGGYEQIYLDLLKKLSVFDLAANAPHLGLEADHKGRVTMNFLGRSYRVDNSGAWPLDGRPVGVNHLSLITHYLMSPGRGEPSYSFLPLGRMTGMVEGRGTYDRASVSTPLIRHFLCDLSGLALAVMRLGGHPEGRGPSGALCWLFHPFPKVPIRLEHHEEDDEFPPDFRLLFDTRATCFMEFEALGFLSGVFVDEICSSDV